MLLTHPITQVIALYAACNYGILHLVISTLSNLWTTRYKQSAQTSGLHHIAFVVGELVGAHLGAPLTDRVWRYPKHRAGGEVTPEYRVPPMIPGAVLVPMGLFVYGWAAEARVFWLVPELGVAVLGAGLTSAAQAVQAYAIDAHPEHAASASAASSFLRSVFGFVFLGDCTPRFGRFGAGPAEWGAGGQCSFASTLRRRRTRLGRHGCARVMFSTVDDRGLGERRMGKRSLPASSGRVPCSKNSFLAERSTSEGREVDELWGCLRIHCFS